jgi:putative ABC transport system ATP-binding protein
LPTSRQTSTAYQQRDYEYFTRLNEDKGITIVLVTHETDIAAYAGRQVHFKDGVVISDEKTPSSRVEA